MQRIFFLILPFLLVSFEGCNREAGKDSGQAIEADTIKPGLARITSEIKRDDRNADLYNLRAKYYLADRKFDYALQDINTALAISDKTPDYFITLADIQLYMGQPFNSMEALNKALLLDDRNKLTLLKLARLNLVMKDYDATFRAVKRLTEIDSYNPQAYFIKAIALLENGDSVQAVYNLMKAADQDQDYFEANIQLGELFSLKSDPVAEGYLKNAIRIRPENPEALYLIGMYYQNSGRYEDALNSYRELMKVDSGFRMAPYNIGYIYLVYLNDMPEAVQSFTAAISIDPEYTEAYYNRGLAYELTGDYQNAYQDYKKALTITVNFQKAIDGLNRLDQKKEVTR